MKKKVATKKKLAKKKGRDANEIAALVVAKATRER